MEPPVQHRQECVEHCLDHAEEESTTMLKDIKIIYIDSVKFKGQVGKMTHLLNQI